MNNSNVGWVGISLVALYLLMSSIREVFFALVLRQINVFVLIGIVFSLATIIFTLSLAGNLRALLTKVNNNKLNIFYINMTTAVAWFSFIFALQFIEPAIATAIITALGPVSTLIVAVMMLKDFRVNRLDIICAVGIMFSIIFLGYLTLTGRSGVKSDSLFLAALGLLGTLISGFTSAANTVVTKRLVIGGFNSRQIMVVRFYFLIFISLFWIILRQIPVQMSADQFLAVAAISFFGISIPLFALQAGIARMDVNSVALMISVAPLITFVFQYLKGGFTVSLYSLAGVLSALAFVVVGIVAKFQMARADLKGKA